MAKIKKKVNHNNERSTWENTAKEQPYLMPGTAEYEEYKDDLQEHDPFRPDDAWHSKQEEICENHSENLVKKAEKAIECMPIRQKVIKQRQKTDEINKVRHEINDKCEANATKKDGKKTAKVVPDDLDNLIYDDGVTEDAFLPKALTKYE